MWSSQARERREPDQPLDKQTKLCQQTVSAKNKMRETARLAQGNLGTWGSPSEVIQPQSMLQHCAPERITPVVLMRTRSFWGSAAFPCLPSPLVSSVPEEKGQPSLLPHSHIQSRDRREVPNAGQKAAQGHASCETGGNPETSMLVPISGQGASASQPPLLG